MSELPPLQEIPLNVTDVRPDVPPMLMPIPNYPPPTSAYPGTLSGNNNVRGISGILLTQITPYSYHYVGSPNHFSDVILPTYSNRNYAPIIRDSLSVIIPYEPIIWIVSDTADGVITFVEYTPAELGYTPPLTVDYWRYVGPYVPGGGLSSVENIGGGPGLVWESTSAGVAYLRTLMADTTPGTEGIVVNTAGDVITIGNSLTGANVGTIGAGTAQVYIDRPGGVFRYRSLVAGTNITLDTVGNDITISSTAGMSLTALNSVGTGVDIYQDMSGTVANIRRINSDAGVGNEGIVVTTSGNTVLIGNSMNGSNPSTTPGAVNIFDTKSANLLLFRSLLAGTNIIITDAGDDIIIEGVNNAPVTLVQSVGAGIPIFAGMSGTVAQMRSFVADTTPGFEGILLSSSATQLGIGTNLVNASPSTTVGRVDLTLGKSGSNLNFRSLVAGAGITLTANSPSASDVTITAVVPVSAVTTAASTAGGIPVYAGMSGTTALLRPVVADTSSTAVSGISVTLVSETIRIGNTMTAANLGAGQPLFISPKTSGGVLNFNTLTGSTTGITVSAPASNVITISNTITGTNLGTGNGTVFSQKNVSTGNLEFNSIAGSTDGVTVSAPVSNVITVNNTLDITPLGGGQSLYSGKVGAVLNFFTLAGSPTGIAISAPVSNVVTISNTLIGQNPSGTVGAVGIYITKPANTNVLQFRSLVAGTNATITAGVPGPSDATLSWTVPTGIPATSIANGSVSNAEFQFLDGVTSNIQTQINSKLTIPTGTNRGVITVNVSGVSVAVNATSAILASPNVPAAPSSTSSAIIACQEGAVSGYDLICSGSTCSTIMACLNTTTSGVNGGPRITGGTCNAIIASSSGGTTGAGTAIIMTGTNSAIMACGDGTTVAGTYSFVAASTYCRTSASSHQVIMASNMCTTSSFASFIVACNRFGTYDVFIGAANNAGIMFCANNTTSGTNRGPAITAGDQNAILCSSSGLSALSAGITMTGTNALIAACGDNVSCTHTNAAVIGGSAPDGSMLASNANNSLTSVAVYAGTTLLTCDAAKKRNMIPDTAGEGSEEMTRRINAVRPYRYRWDHDDPRATPTRGFNAAELKAAFPDAECVKETWREVIHVEKVGNVWRDSKKRVYSESEVDVNPDPIQNFDHQGRPGRTFGLVGRDRPLQHAHIDTTAMFALMLSVSRHIQIQIGSITSKVAALSERVDTLTSALDSM